MDQAQVWRHIRAERAALAEILAGLTEAQWDAPSVCDGWRVRDVAAHAIGAPQLRLRTMPAMLWRGRFDVDRAGLLDGRRRGQAPTTEILAQFERYAGSRHRMPGTLPLPDILVHTQDVVRPLGLRHEMSPQVAAIAADQMRPRRIARIVHAEDVVAHVRMEATDIDWVRGSGPTLRGPMQELLLVCSGRARVATELEGDGLALTH
ncbi:MAG TPA: maleylpyruvate isomerase family mycothiol-dependent enzyme [Marmoricola sp.]|nr:maleylpyruvate isomerase family mycothiol-dependent enzyme [Marmoricola sp.]